MNPRLMGVLNVTPDSFSDGGLHFSPEAAMAHGLQLHSEGAHIVDVGGESTRPGADSVTENEEIRRVIPVIEELNKRNILISIDTSKPEVAKRALAAGATIINDVTGLRNPEMLAIAAHANAHVCIMHMQGEPRTMQASPHYDDVVEEVKQHLLHQAALAHEAGVPKEFIILDPGIGFGKTLAHNIALLKNISQLVDTGYQILVGASRKSFISKLTHAPDANDRLPGSIAAALWAASQGVSILRVHDVAATRQALDVFAGISQ